MQKSEWTALKAHAATMRGVKIRDLFAEDPARFDRFHLSLDGVLFDYSKNKITAETIEKLLALAEACNLEDWREKLFSGAAINSTENRPVLHWALRGGGGKIAAGGKNIGDFVTSLQARIKTISGNIRQGGRFSDIVNIGIGGSDLGPAMVCEALAHMADGPRVHFISNIDGAHLEAALNQCDPESTAFIIASKTFTTLETLTNAESAREWLLEELGPGALPDHLFAVTQNAAGAADFGVPAEHILPMRAWIGGRYSVWSGIGLPVAISLGYKNFQTMLEGARKMDEHFRSAALQSNIPALLALIGIWHRNFCGYNALAVLPYAQNLARFPAYLQQLDMESNGKTIDRQGRKIDYQTAPVIFGEPGTNGQHAFFQLLHQGTDVIPCDFIGFAKAAHSLPGHHEKLLANLLAQSKALMEGKPDNAEEPFRHFEGNRPSSTILLDRLDPYHLGLLLALYEHKVFVQGIVWNINSFDQWGVELGKDLAKDFLEHWPDPPVKETLDSSSANMLSYIKRRSP